MVNEVKKYINDNIKVYAPLTIDLLDEKENSICIQQLPSEPNVVKYFYGGSEGDFDFRILAKNRNKLTALKQLQFICNHFRQGNRIPITDKVLINIEVTASPTLFEYTPKEYYIYQAQFKLKYKGD